MTNFILIDTENLFHRIKHISTNDYDSAAGMAIMIIMNSLRKVYNQFQGDHLVFCREGSSWRKEVFPEYKLGRKLKLLERTQIDIDLDEMFRETLDDFVEFLEKRTNVTILQSTGLEADDLIAEFTKYYPDDKHIIVSSDTDFMQLVSKKVKLYNPVANELWTVKGVFDDDGNPVIDKKTKKPKKIDPEYSLFLKCIRGDKSDGIFSAFPGVRETKIKAAYEDRHTKGYDWNDLMQSEWTDQKGEKRRVLDEYSNNKLLIDLDSQPDEIKTLAKSVIKNQIKTKKVSQVGVWVMKFAEKHNIPTITQNAASYTDMLSNEFPKN